MGTHITIEVCFADGAVGGIFGKSVKVVNSVNKVVFEKETGERGYAVFDLPPGDYEILIQASFMDETHIHISEDGTTHKKHFLFGSY
jgi:hypothetical protein